MPACMISELEEGIQAIMVQAMEPLLLQEQVLQPSSAAKLSPTACEEQALETIAGVVVERLGDFTGSLPQAVRIKRLKDSVQIAVFI